MISNLENKLKFIELLDEMKNVNRVITLKSGRKESDAEHSYHLATMVMVFIDDFPELDVLKCIKIALLHDIVEIFAGDTYFLDKKQQETKKQRELESLNKIEKVLGKSKFYDYRAIILEYQNKKTKESIFVNQLDKLQPLIQIYMMRGKDHFYYKVKIEESKNNKYNLIDDTYGFKKILDIYFDKLEKGNMFYLGE